MTLGQMIQSSKDYWRKNKYGLKKYLINDGKKHPFALIIPGGGYYMCCSFVEGMPFAKELNKQGINAFVLYYRVKKKAVYPNPLDDVITAINEIIANADLYNVDINNYAVFGSSAGGHLAGMYARSDIGYKKYNLPKPSMLCLVYPVVTLQDPTHEGTRNNILGNDITEERKNMLSLEQHIDSDFPKTFLWCGDSDKIVHFSNSVKLDKALTKNNIEHKFNLYPGLDHGIGLAEGTIAEEWIKEAVDFWLK